MSYWLIQIAKRPLPFAFIAISNIVLICLDLGGFALLALITSKLAGELNSVSNPSNVVFSEPVFRSLSINKSLLLSILLLTMRTILHPIIANKSLKMLAGYSLELSTGVLTKKLSQVKRTQNQENFSLSQSLTYGSHGYVLSIYFALMAFIESLFIIVLFITAFFFVSFIPLVSLFIVFVASYPILRKLQRKIYIGTTSYVATGNFLNEFVVKMFDMQDMIALGHFQNFFVSKFRRSRSQFGDLASRITLWMQLPRSLYELSAFLGILLLVILNVVFQSDSSITISVISYFLIMSRVLPSLLRFQNYVSSMKQSQANAKIFLTEYERVENEVEIAIPKMEYGIQITENISSDLVIEGLEFERDGRIILKELNLYSSSGESILIEGRSGVGKSTLARILSGLLEPTKGSVKFGNVDAVKLREDVRNFFSIVDARPVLTLDSIRNNILLGRDIDDSVLLDWFDKFELLQWLHQRELGLDTEISDTGFPGSLGERQRLGIIRAVVEPPRVLILDEATNSIPQELADKVIHSLMSELVDTRIVLISHSSFLKSICDYRLRLS